MMRTESGNFGGIWVWSAAIAGLSVLVGVWNAESPHAKNLSHTPSETIVDEVSHHHAETSPLEQIESTLAQAGCPGWMVLASEGEAALQPPSENASIDSSLIPGDVRQTSLQVAQVPRVSYPNPVRVASRTLFAPPSSSKAKLAVGAADDPDDLLDGVPDLLKEPEAEASQSEESTNDSSSEPEQTETEQADVQPPQAESGQMEPQQEAEPEEVDIEEAGPEESAHEQEEPIQEPVFPGPAAVEELPAEDLPPQQNHPTQRKPTQQEPVPSKPVLETIELPPQQPIKPTTRPAPAFDAPPQLNGQPAPAQVPVTPMREQPIAPEKPRPATPPVQATPKLQEAPQQSPFTPPPAPVVMPTPHSVGTGSSATGKKPDGEKKTYCEFIAESQYPSAQACAKCHEKHYEEWSVSSHAYAAVSPMFHKFEQRINDLSQGTIGYFCYRCHSPVGTTLGVSRATPLWELPLVAREGVTCIACHRVNQRYGKVNGERRIEPGGVHDPVYGPIGGSGVAEVIANKNKYKVKTSPQEKGPGQDIHVAGVPFDQLSKSEFCVSCHQVAVQPGIKLEVVWEQYRASPACKKGISCQDCHMGRIPGVASGYETGAAAKVNDKVVHADRKHANHTFYGPGYSIAHPGIFPHNIDANRWSMKEWLQFDWRADWGTEKFEEMVDNGQIHVYFPPVWAEADDRYDARDIIDDNLKKLEAKDISRAQIMENGSHVDGPFFDTQLVRGQDLKFHYVMTNQNEGHNLPSGSLGAQPQLWANVVLIGPRGQRLWESGYTDRWGDVADIHSEDVRNKRIPYDWQLFNLQTMFLITGAKGTDREFYLPVNFDFDQLPYLRPGAQPTSVINHPPFIRMEGRSLAPLGSRKIPYRVPAELMCEPGHYRLSFRLRSRLEPIYFMRFCGSTKEMIRSMNEGILDYHQSSIEFFVR